MEHQDWKPVILHKKLTKEDAKRSGQTISVKKHNTGNKNTAPVNASKLDTDEIVVPKTVDRALAQRIQSARAAKGMTQKELAFACNVDTKTIQTWENGTAIPNGPLLVKIRKALGDNLK